MEQQRHCEKFSIVIPIYYNEDNISHTLPRLRNLVNLLPTVQLEFIFVDDGSGDRSLQLLLDEQKTDPRMKVIRLSKNFGALAAVQAGLQYATGDCVGIIAADLQDPPELFAEMIGHWQQGKKVVMAVRAKREDSVVSKTFSAIFYFLMDKMALPGYPKGGFDFVVIDKDVVQEVIRYSEKNTNLMSLIYWLGHDRVTIPYVRQERIHGKSMWTFNKKFKLFIDSFISFSYTPIRFISVMGIATALLSVCYGVFVFIGKLTGKVDIEGWTTIMIAITFLLGLIMIMLGIIGEYLWRILDETRNRPSYIIDEVYDPQIKDH